MNRTEGLVQRRNVPQNSDRTCPATNREIDDPPYQSDEDDADSKETRLTLMEEVLLLGLKDKETNDPDFLKFCPSECLPNQYCFNKEKKCPMQESNPGHSGRKPNGLTSLPPTPYNIVNSPVRGHLSLKVTLALHLGVLYRKVLLYILKTSCWGSVEGWYKPLVLDRYDPGSIPALGTFF
ncbi:GOLPH3 [Cordylochernes scorpioides]|uniref:GOLPH3 n=1 Tax=Cordylochernes scorpioides TaxID=51811 RepID=A0ABY6KRK4_9ARAC|nr:GOLPH3 [Cordylochernes scorpioides]